jgi:hypothetical protein
MRPIIVTLAIVVGAAPAVGADPSLSETAQRAAYCSGVLDHQLKTFGPNSPASPENICRRIWQTNFPSFEACIAALMASEERNINQIQQKRSRYSGYLQLEMARIVDANGDNNQAKQSVLYDVAILKRKGYGDAERFKAKPVTPHRLLCEQKCNWESARCLVDCIAEQDATDANVLKCVLLPNELPY